MKAPSEKERRVFPPKDFDGTIDVLKDELKLFGTREQVMMFAAALGFHRGERQPIKSRGKEIRYDIFQRALDDAFIDALAVADTGELKIIADDRLAERITIFEEYAHAGLRVLENIRMLPTNTLEELIRLTQDARQAVVDSLPGLDPSVIGILENV